MILKRDFIMYDDFYEIFLPQPEIWKPVVGYEEIYAVSNLGHIRNIKSGKTLAHKYDKYGVDNVCLSNKRATKSFSVCKLMVASFCKGFEYLDHKDGCLKNNILSNIVVIKNYHPRFNQMASFEESFMTKELVREMFDYHESGYLTWKKRPPEHFSNLHKYRIFNTSNKGKRAGYFNKRTDSKQAGFGYWRVGITLGFHLRHFKLHRLIFLYHYGYLPTVVDHMDGDTNNNKVENLRESDHQQNSCNLNINVNNTTGFKGVTFDVRLTKKPWRAGIVSEGVTYFLGNYGSAEEAAHAYNLASEVLHKDFSRLNIINFDTKNFKTENKFFKEVYPQLLKEYEEYCNNE